MTDIAKCMCGAEAVFEHHGRYVRCTGEGCWDGPYSETEPEAIAAWNRVMGKRLKMTAALRRPADFHLDVRSTELIAEFGTATLGFTDRRRDGVYAYSRVTKVAESGRFETEPEAIVWLISKLTAAGFDVESEEA